MDRMGMRYRVAVLGPVCAALIGWALGVGLAPGRLEAEEPVYRFLLPSFRAYPGDSVRVTVQGEHAESAEGFSMGLRFPSPELRIDRVHIEDTILEAIGSDYLETKLSVEQGTLVIGFLVDVVPPFTGTLIPAIGQPLDFVHLEVTIDVGVREDLVIALEDGLSLPPIQNVYSVNGLAIPVTELGECLITVCWDRRQAGLFLRGDVNMDGGLDISDPIRILGFVFLGERYPPCMEAVDVNDDDAVDIADPVFLLSYLFEDTAPPPPPHSEPGADVRPGSLGCLSTLWITDEP